MAESKMIYRAAALILTLCVGGYAHAYDTANGLGTTWGNIITVPSGCQERFLDLPALADRLGVQPGSVGYASVVLSMCDGTSYDLFALMNAFLDRVDAAAKGDAR